jgi:hypothetical protein
MKWLGAVFVALILPLLPSEFTGWCLWLAKWLVRRAACRLPEDARARWEEEWLADLETWEDRKLSVLVRGLWIFVRAPSWGRRALLGLPSLAEELRARIVAFVRRSREQQTAPTQGTEPPEPTTPDRQLPDPQLEQLRRHVSRPSPSTDRPESLRERQQRELEEIRRSFEEIGPRMGSLFEPVDGS